MKIIYPKPWGSWSEARKEWVMAHVRTVGVEEDEVLEVMSIHPAKGSATVRVKTLRGSVEVRCRLPVPA